MNEQRIGDWIQTSSGVKLYILDTRPEDFRIEDIAHALALTCRFGGHCSKYYSVAEHSVRVARLIKSWGYIEAVQYAGLMHDNEEAYLPDLPRPFKRMPEFAFYREMGDRLMGHIASRFLVQYPFHQAVHDADSMLLGTEARDLMNPTDNWHLKYEMLPGKVRPWSPRKAKREFLSLFYKLNPLGVKKPRWSWFG